MSSLYLDCTFGLAGAGTVYLYVDLSNVTDYVIQSGDVLEYEVQWPNSDGARVAFDFKCTDGSTLRDSGAQDQNAIDAHPVSGLSGHADAQWYARQIAVPAGLVGKTINKFMAACEHQTGGGDFTGWLRNIKITDGAGTTRKAIWLAGDDMPSVVVEQNSDADNNVLDISDGVFLPVLGDEHPDVQALIAFGYKPTDTVRVYTNVTEFMRSFKTDHGRGSEFEDADAALLNLTLDNEDRRFETGYTLSPYYPNVKRRVQILLRARWADVVEPQFKGYIESWTPRWLAGGFDATVEVVASDAFKVLGLSKLDATYARGIEKSGARIAAAAAFARIPSAETNLDVGSGDLAAKAAGSLDGTITLDHAKTSARSDFGLLFAARDGKLTFHDRGHRVNSVSLWTFGDGEGELPYVKVEPENSDTDIFNDVRVRLADGSESVATDSASQDEYMICTKTIDTELANVLDADSIATYVLTHHSDPDERVKQLDLDGSAAPDLLWPAVLGMEISDHVLIIRRPDDTETRAFEVHVEHVSHDAKPGSWKTSVYLSPADQQPYWQLGTVGFSELGDTTRLSF